MKLGRSLNIYFKTIYERGKKFEIMKSFYWIMDVLTIFQDKQQTVLKVIAVLIMKSGNIYYK